MNAQTPRLRLRPLALEDTPALYNTRSQEIVHKWLPTGPWKNLEAARTDVCDAIVRPGSYYTAIELLSTSETIGYIGINIYDSVFYVLDPVHWGKGYCPEALRAFLTLLFETDEWKEKSSVDAWILEGNQASVRVMEKCGFEIDLGKSEIVQGWMENEKEEARKEGNSVEGRNDWVRRPFCWTYKLEKSGA